MSSTNKTTNYDLSQYIGSDKPTYLSDYNGDMYKIDAQMKVNADNVATAISTANTATSTANTASSTASSALSTAQSASSTATSASTTATTAQTTANSALSTAITAQTTANSALTKANDLADLLTFTHFDDITLTTNNGTIGSQSMKIASNENGTVAKIYGRVSITGSNNIVTLTGTSRLRPETNITISGIGIMGANSNDGNYTKFGNTVDVTISTNGNISMTSNYAWGDQKQFFAFPCVLFLVDFGDTPSPEE